MIWYNLQSFSFLKLHVFFVLLRLENDAMMFLYEAKAIQRCFFNLLVTNKCASTLLLGCH